MTQFNIRRTGDADYPRTMNILLMGPPKSGKTTFLSTMPNVVVAACEAGLMSIAHKNVPYVDIDGSDKLQTLLLILQDEKLRAQQAKNLGLSSIESVAIDTVDALQDVLKKEILKENRRTQMQRDDWGVLKERMSALIKAFTALPVNVVLTVHTEVTQDENGKQIYAPNLQGAIKNDIAGMVDFSLMTFRQKETALDGTSAIRYYLKNEGDDKNPHLGNRSQGRVPEICEPNFLTLHTLTFTGINPTVINEDPSEVDPASQPTPDTGQAEAPEPPTEEVAQKVSQSETQSAPTGVPATSTAVDDSDEPINAAGITMLTKEYEAQGLVKPTDLDAWTLGKARSIAKFFVAWKADAMSGKVTKDDLIGFLQATDAYVATVDEVQTPVETPKKAKSAAKAAVAKADPVAEEEPPVAEATEEEAVALVKDQLGGVEIGQKIDPNAKCEECGQQIDDPDVAQLAWSRFQKVLCVNDYKAMTKK